jgi:hypothetical protein
MVAREQSPMLVLGQYCYNCRFQISKPQQIADWNERVTLCI